jgi:hypothetical protein
MATSRGRLCLSGFPIQTSTQHQAEKGYCISHGCQEMAPTPQCVPFCISRSTALKEGGEEGEEGEGPGTRDGGTGMCWPPVIFFQG